MDFFLNSDESRMLATVRRSFIWAANRTVSLRDLAENKKITQGITGVGIQYKRQYKKCYNNNNNGEK